MECSSSWRRAGVRLWLAGFFRLAPAALWLPACPVSSGAGLLTSRCSRWLCCGLLLAPAVGHSLCYTSAKPSNVRDCVSTDANRAISLPARGLRAGPVASARCRGRWSQVSPISLSCQRLLRFSHAPPIAATGSVSRPCASLVLTHVWIWERTLPLVVAEAGRSHAMLALFLSLAPTLPANTPAAARRSNDRRRSG